MKLNRKQLRILIHEVFKKGLSSKAIRHMSGLDSETISTIEDIEARGPEYKQQGQDLAISMGSLEPETYHYDMNQTGISLSYYKYNIIYNRLQQAMDAFGPFSDSRFILRSHLKQYVESRLGKNFEDIKFVMAINSLLKDRAIIEKKEKAWDSEQIWTETYYSVR